MGQIMFCNYSVTPCNLFVITMHYVNIVLTPTVCGSGERNGVQRKTKVSFGSYDASIRTAAVGKKACFWTKQC